MSPIETKSSIVVITGVTRGLGRAMAVEFIRRGHTVFGCGRTREQIDQLRHQYPDHHFHRVDVTSDAAVNHWARSILKIHAGPDLLINNAAILNPRAPLWCVGDQIFGDLLDTNIKGVVNTVRNFVPSMIRRKYGFVINVCSRWGNHLEPTMAPYCATKWAALALTRVLAAELKPEGVSVVGLNPGIVRTAMLQQYLDGGSTPRTAHYPTPAQWARVAVPLILRFRSSDTGKVRNITMSMPVASGALTSNGSAR
jgi:NAD(P)-dependent dehydrogenase (short-subunit alcohol dehydrogenase family)